MFVFNRLVARSGDLMAGALITGRMGTLTRTERFYASYPTAALRQLYFSAASKMVRRLTAKNCPRPLPAPELWQGNVGARLCAKDDKVEGAITALKEEIETVRGVKRKRTEFHNLLTLYAVMYFCFSTSCRPIRTPFLSMDRVDKDTGFAYLSDKDDDANHKMRLIWVPELCRKQMNNYAEHCRRLAREHAAIHDWPDPCFFLTKNREPVLVRPTTLAIHLKPFLQLPLNFYRVYLRHRLLQAGTPPEAVMAWLGHAFAGEEIWNTHSAMSARDYRECISKKLPKILEELGWAVLK